MTAAKTTPAMFRCGACGALTPVELAMESTAASRVVTRCMQSLGDVGPALLGYMALHRPPRRVLTWEKVERLLTELLGWYDAEAITRDHVTHALTDAVWLEALGAVKDAATKTLTLPLDGNSYLAAILASKARLAADAARQARDAALRGETPVGYSAAHVPVSPLPLGEATRSVGEGKDAATEARKPMPADVAAKLSQLGRRSRLLGNADSAMLSADSGAAGHSVHEPMSHKGKLARVVKGDARGKSGEVVRHEGETVWVRINQPRLGERVITKHVSEVEL